MKIIVTTSNEYSHIVPIFCHLFNKFWNDGQRVEIVGYDYPNYSLPTNFTFVRLGKQTPDKQNFTRDLRKYFAKQPKYFIWMMEDTFLKVPVDFKYLNFLKSLTDTSDDNIGRINLSREVVKQDHELYRTYDSVNIYRNSKFSLYRLSTQPSIWNKHFLLQYMVEDLSPWEFECQSDHAEDEFKILGLDQESPVKHNEGVRKKNLYDYNFEGIPREVIEEMKQLNFI